VAKSTSSCYAYHELPDGKGLAVKPYGDEGYYFRFMENGRGVGERYRADPGQFLFHRTGWSFNRRGLKIYGIGTHVVEFQGLIWCRVRAADWAEVFRLADQIREGASTYDMAIYRRNRVLMKTVAATRSS